MQRKCKMNRKKVNGKKEKGKWNNSNYPKTAWQDIKDFRNILIHESRGFLEACFGVTL